ncbi:hypothetical protein FJY93_02310 [Candidatus Kaiserbacteria bacterium]|nr:hypothetical protein [Candidatus Kaiserbacteria bacterium]
MENHTEEQAKDLLRAFLQGRILSFTTNQYDDGSWLAECNEIPAITTGTTGDYSELDTLMRDAIVSAAGIRGDYGYLLQWKGFKVPSSFLGFTRVKSECEPYYVVQS